MSSDGAFLILADEAAGWRIGGLHLLDRLVLALNEFVETRSNDEIVQVVILWHPNVPSGSRWLPRHPRITRIRLTEALKTIPAGARVLHTRVFVRRNGLAELLHKVPAVYIDEAPEETILWWNKLSTQFLNSLPPRSSQESWQLVQTSADFGMCERALLRNSAKSQDGIISRFLNRPLSRWLSRFLLGYDITPTAWTTCAFALPVLAFICLSRGDYVSIVVGALIFQIYSVVDGCDGEIARATYQESERGGRVDDFLDMAGSILYVIGLGFGLFRSGSSFYLLEGLLCAAVIAVNEWSLRRVQLSAGPESEKLRGALYPRHRRLMAGAGTGKLNDNLMWWILQFTKRDAAILAFLILALLDLSPWILHLWLTVSAATLALSARSSSGKGATGQSRA
ncbi:MAG: CDP-alcohol phosphatidyltransferase family protein [Chthoniobacterales bacterium]